MNHIYIIPELSQHNELFYIISELSQHQLNIMFIFDRCRRGLTAATPVKYERD